MSYLAPETIARAHGVPYRKNGQCIYPLLRRGLPPKAVELGKIIQSGAKDFFPCLVGRDPFLPLVCNDHLSFLRSVIPNVAKLYVRCFETYVIALHDDLLAGKRKKFPNGFWAGWQGEINLCILTDYFFNQRLGIVMDWQTKTIDPRTLDSNQLTSLLASFGHTVWEDLFADYKLLGGIYRVFNGSVAKTVQTTFPWAFDLSTPEGYHAHPWDFITQNSRTAANSQQLKNEAVLHILRQHLGLVLDPKSKTFDQRLLPQNQAAFLREHGCSSWTELFRKFGLAKFTRWGGQKQKIFRLFKEAAPWLFDLSTPEGRHLHYPDFRENKMFDGSDGRELLLEYLRHLLEKHHRLRMDEKTGYIDPRLFTLAGQKKFLKANGFKCWSEFLRKYGLEKILPQIIDFRVKLNGGKYAGSLIKAFRALYPWAFDLSRPEGKHLHFWQFPSPYKWFDLADSRIALEHELATAGIAISEAPRKCSFAWFKSVGLSGLVMYYDGSPTRVFKTLFPEKFSDGTLNEADFHFQFGLQKTAPATYRKIVKIKTWQATRGFLEMDRVKYYFPKKYAEGYVARKESAEHVIICEAQSIAQNGKDILVIGRPVKVFYTVRDKKIHRPKLIDFDEREHPFLSEDLREELFKNGILPQALSIKEQISILSHVQQNGIGQLALILSKMGLI